MTNLVFREKILKSSGNTILIVPNLSNNNLILKTIDFETEQWEFEINIKYAGNDLIRMTPTYFKHYTSIDLSGYRSKIEDGDKLELHIKPKQAPRDIELVINYTYENSEGAIYYQSTDRLIDLKESKILSDITQNMQPTHLYLKSDSKIEKVAIIPKFHSSEENLMLSFSCQPKDFTCDLDFNSPELLQLLPLLRFCTLQITVSGDNIDSQIYSLARGFKL